jgi:hypothetical protein
MTTRADRELLAEVNGHYLLAARANRHGLTLLTKPRRTWSRRQDGQHEREPGEKRPGRRLVSTAAVLLFALGLGLLAVSYAAQYRYVLDQRHQAIASLIEAGALDVGLIIFSLLALGLALAGLSAKTERGLIMACAVGSAVMNYAAADVTSPRSVLAFCMPPVFLAVVVDRVVVVIRRHVLGMREGHSPWTVLATGAARLGRFGGLVALYSLRLVLAPASTCAGIRRAILNATPLPAVAAADEPKAIDPPPGGCLVCGKPLPCPDHRRRKPERRRRRESMTSRFLALVIERYGPLAGIPLERVSPICTELAPEIGIDAGNARTALRKAVLVAAGEGDAK